MPAKKTSKKKEAIEIPQEQQMSLMKEKFLDIIKQMLCDERNIGHLLFNGIFRLPMNKRLYEFSDEEIVKAFETQLGIMLRKHEKSVCAEKKNEKLKQVLE